MRPRLLTRGYSSRDPSHAAADSEYRDLQQAFGRRAVIEQAKGILMGRNAIDGDAAFAIMRDHSQRSGRKLVTVAEGIVANYLLLSTGCQTLPWRLRTEPSARVGTPIESSRLAKYR